jgi:hypothetical protein
MQGSSKLIMDSNAFDRVYSYYMNDFEKNIKGKKPLADIMNNNQIGMAFRSMIDLERFKNFRESLLKKLRTRIHSITLSEDKIIPPGGVISTLNSINNHNVAEVWDFPYTYSHENPFPVLASPLSEKVDRCFERVFSKAREFLR